jgi:hypothetical protein
VIVIDCVAPGIGALAEGGLRVALATLTRLSSI